MYRSFTCLELVKSYYLMGVIVFMTFLYGALFRLFVFNPSDQTLDIVELILFVPLQITYLMVIWSMIRVIISDPGKVPVYYGVLMDDSETKKRRYCLICHIFKPDRCHHCSTCRRCVLNMDHHCPWIGNCVGYQNRKFFLLFLFYINITVVFALIICLVKLIPIFIHGDYRQIFSNLDFQLQTLTFLVLIVFASMISNFFKFHLGLISENRTTIDTLEMKRNNLDPITHPNIYDVGMTRNWLQVMGKNYWLWPFPLFGESGRPVGDGVHWEKP